MYDSRSQGVLFIAFTPQWLAVDLQIGNAGWPAQWHERMTARPGPLARRRKGKARQGKDGRLAGRFVCLLKMKTKRRWRLSTHGRLGGGVLYTQLQLH